MNEAAGTSNASDFNDEEIQREIMRALRGLGYGSVEILVHDSKVVQIERKEKIRFQNQAPSKRR
jgi:hypothetical protein